MAFDDAVNDVTRLATKIPAGMYQATGENPIYDQSQNEIAGYADHTNGLFDHSLPVVIFGDHTRVVKLADRPFFLGADGTKALRPKILQVDPHYLYVWMKSINLPNHGYSRHFKFLKETRIPLPPLDEQRRIVDLLSRAAGVRKLREQALAKAREIIPALFLEMFGDPATNPKGWPVVRLGEVIAQIDSGWSPKGDGAAPTDDEWAILKLGAVTWGEFDPSAAKRLPNDAEPRPELEVRPGDILLARKNTYDLVGSCAHVWNTRPKLMLPDLIFRLVINDPLRLHAVFFWAALSNSFVRSQIRTLASGSAESMPNISKARLRQLAISLPSFAVQVEFAARVTEIRSIIAQAERSLAAAKALERSLMARLLDA